LFLDEQSERVLIAMIPDATMAHPDRLIKRHFAASDKFRGQRK
jgi:hypothetical protein